MTAKRLLVVADDLGLSPEIDEGILEVVRSGRITVVAVLINPPHESDLAPFLQTDVSLGIHFNLTHGRPCLGSEKVPSLVDGTGQFLPDRERLLARMVRGHAEQEIMGQLQRFRQLVGKEPEYISFHKHLHAHDPVLLEMAIHMARQLSVSLRTIDSPMRDVCRAHGVKTCDHFIGAVRPAPFWTIDRLSAELAAVPPGLTELMCHPGHHVRPIQGHWYIEQRDTERETLLSDEAGEILSGFRLVNCPAAFQHHGLKKTLHS